MNKLRFKKLAVFLTDGMSLEKWDKVGSFSREVAPYNFLAKYFQEIYIITYGGKEDFVYKGKLAANIFILNKKESNIPDFLYQFVIPFRFYGKLKKCDFYKTNQLYGSIPAVIAKILNFKSKLIIRCGYIASLNAKLYKKGLFWRIYTNVLEKIAFCFSNRIFIAGKANGDYLKAKYKLSREKIEVLNNGIDTDIFKPISLTKEFDIGYVGRLEKDKNLLNLLKAVRNKDLRIFFIGKGEKYEKLMEYATKNKINLKIIDKIDNSKLPDFYNRFRIFSFPSLHEGNPKVLLEAMACGLPVLACNVVGVNSIIKNRENGILTETDIDSIRNGMEEILNDESLRRKIAENGRKLIEENYSLNKILQKEMEIYEKILS